MDKFYMFTFMLSGLYLFEALWDALKGEFERLGKFGFFILVIAAIKIGFKFLAWVIAL